MKQADFLGDYQEDVCYDVDIKGKTRRILDHVDGWVKPGNLTALMVSLNAITVPLSTE